MVAYKLEFFNLACGLARRARPTCVRFRKLMEIARLEPNKLEVIYQQTMKWKRVYGQCNRSSLLSKIFQIGQEFRNRDAYVDCAQRSCVGVHRAVQCHNIDKLSNDTVPNHTFITTNHQALFIYNQTKISGRFPVLPLKNVFSHV